MAEAPAKSPAEQPRKRKRKDTPEERRVNFKLLQDKSMRTPLRPKMPVDSPNIHEMQERGYSQEHVITCRNHGMPSIARQMPGAPGVLEQNAALPQFASQNNVVGHISPQHATHAYRAPPNLSLQNLNAQHPQVTGCPRYTMPENGMGQSTSQHPQMTRYPHHAMPRYGMGQGMPQQPQQQQQQHPQMTPYPHHTMPNNGMGQGMPQHPQQQHGSNPTGAPTAQVPMPTGHRATLNTSSRTSYPGQFDLPAANNVSQGPSTGSIVSPSVVIRNAARTMHNHYPEPRGQRDGTQQPPIGNPPYAMNGHGVGPAMPQQQQYNARAAQGMHVQAPMGFHQSQWMDQHVYGHQQHQSVHPQSHMPVQTSVIPGQVPMHPSQSEWLNQPGWRFQEPDSHPSVMFHGAPVYPSDSGSPNSSEWHLSRPDSANSTRNASVVSSMTSNGDSVMDQPMPMGQSSCRIPETARLGCAANTSSAQQQNADSEASVQAQPSSGPTSPSQSVPMNQPESSSRLHCSNHRTPTPFCLMCQVALESQKQTPVDQQAAQPAVEAVQPTAQAVQPAVEAAPAPAEPAQETAKTGRVHFDEGKPVEEWWAGNNMHELDLEQALQSALEEYLYSPNPQVQTATTSDDSASWPEGYQPWMPLLQQQQDLGQVNAIL